MAGQTCPKCGTRFPDSEGWAKSALSTLIPAPAVRDRATQVRCPKCQYLFAEGEVRYWDTVRSSDSAVAILLLAAALFVWAIYKILWV